jgi:uncharacterized protein YabE (DUF348 family)
MIPMLKKHRSWLLPAAFLLIAGGLALIWIGLHQQITVLVDGEAKTVRTAALRISGALRAAGITPQPADRVNPQPARWFWREDLIAISPARSVLIRTPEAELSLITAEKIPANILQEAGLTLYPGDIVRWNGQAVDHQAPLSISGPAVLQVVPAVPLVLEIDGRTETFYTQQATLGAALEGAGILLAPEDRISEDLSTPVADLSTVTIHRARPVSVILGAVTISGQSAAQTVGDALSDLGLALQHLNYSIPPEDASLPTDGQIRVVHVQEEILVATEEVPHQSEYQEDPNTPLDQVSVIQPGQNGIFATRERVRYADGEEIWRDVEPTWQASEPQTAIIGYGTNIVEQTAVVEGETLSYYRKITVWTTSYKPCNDYTGECHYGTSSGLPVEKGVIAVSYDWYLLLQGQRLYVSGYGYGVIADVCGGCVGKPWIDLGYSEENYAALHVPNAWRTIYFLTPIPDYVPLLLP